MKNQAKHCKIKVTFKDGSELICTYFRGSATEAINQAKKDNSVNYAKVEYLGINK